MSQRIVTIKSLKTASKVCNSPNSSLKSLLLLKNLSISAERFDSDFRNSNGFGEENRIELQHNTDGQFKGNIQTHEFNQTSGRGQGQIQRNEFQQNLSGYNGTQFSSSENPRTEIQKSSVGEDGKFSSGYNQENYKNDFGNNWSGENWKGNSRFTTNEFGGNGYYVQSTDELSRNSSAFSQESLSNSLNRSNGSGREGAGSFQQNSNQFYGLGSPEANGGYGQKTTHSQQVSSNYSMGNMKNVGTSQQGFNNSHMGSTGNFQHVQSNYYGDVVGHHHQSPSSYDGNNFKGFNGYPGERNGEYQQNPSVDYRTNAVPQRIPYQYHNVMGEQVAGNSTNSGGLIEGGDADQPKSAVEQIEGLCKEGKLKEAREMLDLLDQQGIPVDIAQYFRLMKVCGEDKALEEAKHVHDLFNRRKFPNEVSSYNKILEMYCMCGSMKDAYDVFNNMTQRNLTSWDTMILWLAKNGLAEEAIDLFTRFKESGLRPDAQIFFSVFSACSFLGDTTEGLLHFESMSKTYGIAHSMEHYIGVVDMLGSVGYLDEALDFVQKMPVEPSIDVWEKLMMFCRVHGNIELGDHCAELVKLLDPSRLPEQSKAGLIPVKASDIEKEKQKKKLTSQNLLEVRSRVHEYRAGDTSHPDNDKIYALLRGMRQQMKEAGYVPETKFVLHDIDQESKEDALLGHSERLAVAQGLMTSPARQQLRIIKNLRVCGDCHNAMKIMSKLVGRELIARDAKRFHHFKDGLCSCRDYW